MWDDTGYDLDDPKHPTFHERYADYADLLRKREKESSLSEPGAVSPDAAIKESADVPGSESDEVEGYQRG
jgi:hypothetical protein